MEDKKTYLILRRVFASKVLTRGEKYTLLSHILDAWIESDKGED